MSHGGYGTCRVMSHVREEVKRVRIVTHSHASTSTSAKCETEDCRPSSCPLGRSPSKAKVRSQVNLRTRCGLSGDPLVPINLFQCISLLCGSSCCSHLFLSSAYLSAVHNLALDRPRWLLMLCHNYCPSLPS